ncbi:MAG: 30S ribosomal protein S9 [Patescibacteria group bacterium]|jgi:small subunit ribosomal protein S9
MSDKKPVVKKTVAKKITSKESSENKSIKKDDVVKVEFSGKYFKGLGRRKTAVAQVRLYTEMPATEAVVNGKNIKDYFGADLAASALQPLEVTGHSNDVAVSIIAKGGGLIGQVAAVRHGVARAVLALDPETHTALKTDNFLTRDKRAKERKKPGLKKARKRPQWSKR